MQGPLSASPDYFNPIFFDPFHLALLARPGQRLRCTCLGVPRSPELTEGLAPQRKECQLGLRRYSPESGLHQMEESLSPDEKKGFPGVKCYFPMTKHLWLRQKQGHF